MNDEPQGSCVLATTSLSGTQGSWWACQRISDSCCCTLRAIGYAHVAIAGGHTLARRVVGQAKVALRTGRNTAAACCARRDEISCRRQQVDFATAQKQTDLLWCRF